jgi:hypothetical protein
LSQQQTRHQAQASKGIFDSRHFENHGCVPVEKKILKSTQPSNDDI